MNEWMEFPWVFSCSKFAITELFKIWVRGWYWSDSLYDITRITMIRGCICAEFPKFRGMHCYCVWNMAVLLIFNAEEYLSLLIMIIWVGLDILLLQLTTSFLREGIRRITRNVSFHLHIQLGSVSFLIKD